MCFKKEVIEAVSLFKKGNKSKSIRQLEIYIEEGSVLALRVLLRLTLVYDRYRDLSYLVELMPGKESYSEFEFYLVEMLKAKAYYPAYKLLWKIYESQKFSHVNEKLAKVSELVGDFSTSVKLYKEYLSEEASKYNSEKVAFRVVELLNVLNQKEAAIDFLETFYQHAPKNSRYFYIKHLMLEESGLYQESIECLYNAEMLDYPEMRLKIKAKILDSKKPEDLEFKARLDELRELSKESSFPSLFFSLGKAYEVMGYLDIAKKYYIKANRLSEVSYRGKLTDCLSFPLWERNDFECKSPSDLNIIWIVGLYRSGTSLLEGILSSIENVVDMGEVPIVSSFVSSVGLNRLSETKVLSDFKDIYSRNITYLNSVKGENKFFIDKCPDNFQYFELLLSVFPKGKFLFMDRKLKDNFVSLFKCEFTDSVIYSTEWEECKKYYNKLSEIKSTAKERYPNNVIEVEYEKLVSQPELILRGLLQFLSIDNSDETIHSIIKNRKKTTRTASVRQIGNDINQNSVNISSNFREFFD